GAQGGDGESNAKHTNDCLHVFLLDTWVQKSRAAPVPQLIVGQTSLRPVIAVSQAVGRRGSAANLDFGHFPAAPPPAVRKGSAFPGIATPPLAGGYAGTGEAPPHGRVADTGLWTFSCGSAARRAERLCLSGIATSPLSCGYAAVRRVAAVGPRSGHL